MEFFCPANANIMICENRGTFGKWMHAMEVTVSPHIFALLNKTPSSTRRENILMQKVWRQDRRENGPWGKDILCLSCLRLHRVALSLLLALALPTVLMSLGSFQMFLATCVNEQTLKYFTQVFFFPLVSIDVSQFSFQLFLAILIRKNAQRKLEEKIPTFFRL